MHFEERGRVVEKRYIAKNGVEIFAYKNPSLHSFYISLFLRSGCMYEKESENGITHFLEHALVRNVNKLKSDKLYSELDSLGLELNASTYAEMVQFYTSGASSRFSHAAEIISLILSPIILTRAELDAERKRIKAEIRESDEKSSLTAFSNGIVHAGTPLSMSIVGSNSCVGKISLKRLEEYRRTVFTRENVFFYVTGNFTDADIEYLSECISRNSIESGVVHDNIAPVAKDFGKRPNLVHVKNADYTMLRFSFDLDMSKMTVPETDLIYDILFSGYASRFFMELSERRGIIYDISGALERYRNTGQLFFSFELSSRDVYSALHLSVEILNKLKCEMLSESEMMKAAYVDGAYSLYDDAREFNFTMAYDAHVMKLPYLSIEDRIAAYRAVTPERLRALANDIFNSKNLVFTMKGSKKKTNTSRIADILSMLDKE